MTGAGAARCGCARKLSRCRWSGLVIASEAKQSILGSLDCFVASLLAMTSLFFLIGKRSLSGIAAGAGCGLPATFGLKDHRQAEGQSVVGHQRRRCRHWIGALQHI